MQCLDSFLLRPENKTKMYSNKKNIGILTSLLLAHGVRHIVVCPGSRNAPLAHNFSVCEDFKCYNVTDERSAGFYALGLAQALNEAVAVCVTSGTALLNLAPAVAEAYYQRVPILVISADRPAAWIDQKDGQTLPQQDALGRFVRKAISLGEPVSEEDSWHCNRLVNEALLELRHRYDAPVHINVEISEPLFNFTQASLHKERVVIRIQHYKNEDLKAYDEILDSFIRSPRPLLLLGQMNNDKALADICKEIRGFAVVLSETTNNSSVFSKIDETLMRMDRPEDFLPDFVLYAGGNIVSKRLKSFLRSKDSEQWSIDEDGSLYDTFMNLKGVLEGETSSILKELALRARSRETVREESGRSSYLKKWEELQKGAEAAIKTYSPAFSQFAAVKYFEAGLEKMEKPFKIHYANSTSIRLANIFSNNFVRCNRGVNGIEGSLSTAAGMSLACEEPVYCVIGDLSFFYDQNALWNNDLRGNFRILLLNNGGGGIFGRLQGLEVSAALESIMAKHHIRAEGCCHQNGVLYRHAQNLEELSSGIDWLISVPSSRPVLLEVISTEEQDNNAWKSYFEAIKLKL